MASVNEKELAKMIKNGELSGAFYLYGTDHYSIEKYCRSMCAKLVAKGDETYNLHRFQGTDLDVEGVCEACEAYPMFADKLCVTVCDLDLETETKSRPGHSALSADRLEQLYQAVSDLPETTVLIFYTSNADLCGGKKYPTAKNKKLIDLVSKNGTVCELNIKTRAESVKSISSMLSKQGCKIGDRAAGLIYDRCCGDMNMISNEISKLSAYSEGRDITEEDVLLLTPDNTGAKAFSLADAAASGNAAKTMELYRELIADPDNSPVYLLYILTGSMNDLYRARLAIDSGKSVSDTVKDFRYGKALEFRVNKAFSSVRRMDIASLRRCLEILSKADIDMKSGAGEPEAVLEKSIVQMLSR